MIDCNFKEAPADGDYRYAYEPWLFQCPGHLHLQSAKNWHSFFAIDNKTQSVLAHLHVNINGQVGVSPLKASFGSYQCTKDIMPVVLFRFIEFTLGRLSELGVKKLEVKNPPTAYLPGLVDLIAVFLLNLGFEVIDAEVGAYLNVEDDFRGKLNKWEMRRIRQSEKEGLVFRILPGEELQSVYSFILGCRQERGYTLSMDWETLRKTASAFHDRFLLFGIWDDDLLAAATIAINVGNGVMYNFHSAHPREYDHLSPVVLLMEGLHTFCGQQDYRILDLGTSAADGRPNFGLLDFKIGLGAIPTTKFTFRKEW